MASSVGGAGRYMAYSPSPSAPPSPHLSGLRSAASSAVALLDQEKYHLTPPLTIHSLIFSTVRSDRLLLTISDLLCITSASIISLLCY
uniref:Uncharacterized protein n=1 Tax=Fagus sylvatica TaxID=28930 RepID=A0A2N9JA87_FAGSY